MSLSNEGQAIYVMWIRQLKHFGRARARIAASIVQPLFFLFILGSGFNQAMFPGLSGNYLIYLAPGIIGMAILFSSMFTGISVLWDKQFGFLQEVLVAPIKRLSIIIGFILGGATQALIQGSFILVLSFFLGVRVPSIGHFALTIVLMITIAFTAVGFGLILASKLNDFQAFPLIMNLIILPLFFLSSAFFPVENLPAPAGSLVLANPLFYMVDGLRGSLTGMNFRFHPLIDLGVVLLVCIIMLTIGTYLFNKSEV